MTHTPAKDFGPIADDYAFFERQATEAHADAAAHVAALAGSVPAAGPIRMLDFGCGSGAFTVRFLQQAGWPAERLQLTLVEPAESQRRLAVSRLASAAAAPISDSAALPAGLNGGFDVVLSNHVFYYVPNLRERLGTLIAAVSPSGRFVTSIASRANVLIELWIAAFGLLGRDAPYHVSEDVEAALQELNANYRKQVVPYDLTFPDTEENRLRILRFLLADHLPLMPRQPLLDFFDQYRNGNQIEIHTASDHYTIRVSVEA